MTTQNATRQHVRFFSAFNTSYVGSLEILLDDGVNQTVTLPVGNYFVPFSASIDYVDYYSLIQEMSRSLNVSSSFDFDVRYDYQTNKCILSSSQTFLGMTFSPNLQKALGFSNQYANTNVITGSKQIGYCFKVTQFDIANDSDIYETNQIVNERISDGGRSYANWRTDAEYVRDFSFVNEPAANIWEYSYLQTDKTDSFCWQVFLQELLKGCSPFTMYRFLSGTQASTITYADREGTYLMQPESYNFKPKLKNANSSFYRFADVDVNCKLLDRPNSNLNDLYPNPSAVTSSLVLSSISGCVGHYIADRGIVLSTGSYYDYFKAQRWEDQSGNSNHITMSAGDVYMPLYNQILTIDKPAITSGQSDQYLSRSSMTEFLTGSMTFAAVMNIKNNPTIGSFISLIDPNQYISLMLNGARAIKIEYSNRDANTESARSSATFASDIPFLLIGIFDRSSGSNNKCSCWINGSGSNVKTSGVTLYNFGTTRMEIGSSTNVVGLTANTSASFYETAIYNRVLSSTELNQIVNYVTGTYQIRITSSF